jgi:hypothetical protein
MYKPYGLNLKIYFLFSVSHTTDDLVFEWFPEDKVRGETSFSLQSPQLKGIVS